MAEADVLDRETGGWASEWVGSGGPRAGGRRYLEPGGGELGDSSRACDAGV